MISSLFICSLKVSSNSIESAGSKDDKASSKDTF